MLHQVEARFTCSQKTTRESEHQSQTDVELGAVTNGDDDWEAFTDATPMGSIDLTISEGYPAGDFFEPGKTYRVIFEPVD